MAGEKPSRPIGVGLPVVSSYRTEMQKLAAFLLDDVPEQARLKRELLNESIKAKHVEKTGEVTVKDPITSPEYYIERIRDAQRMAEANLHKYKTDMKNKVVLTGELTLPQRVAFERQIGAKNDMEAMAGYAQMMENCNNVVKDITKQAELTEQQRAQVRAEYEHNFITGHHTSGYELDGPPKALEAGEYKQRLDEIGKKFATISVEKGKDGKIDKVVQKFTNNKDDYNSDASIKATANGAVAAWGPGTQVKLAGWDPERLFHGAHKGMSRDGTFREGLSRFTMKDEERYYQTQLKYLLQAAEAGLKVNPDQVKAFRPEDQKTYQKIWEMKKPEHDKAIEKAGKYKIAPAETMDKDDRIVIKPAEEEGGRRRSMGMGRGGGDEGR